MREERVEGKRQGFSVREHRQFTACYVPVARPEFGLDLLAELVCRRGEMKHCAVGEGERESLSIIQI
jgi:hypothetical protein